MLCIQGDGIVLREAKQATNGRTLHGIHGGRVLHDRVREAVTPELGKHPAHHGDSVDEDTAVSTDASSALEAARRGEVLAWAAGNHEDQRARREAGCEVAEWPLARGVVVFANQVPDIPSSPPVLGLPRQVGANHPAAFHGPGEIVILFSEDGGMQEGIDIMPPQGVD